LNKVRKQGGNVASVELKGLTKRYGDAVAVDGVSLRVDHGQLVCLLGPSGCGKTTTLRLIAGFIEPSAGEIVVGGKVVSSPQRTLPPEGRNMSMIFQSYALWPHMTVAENVAYGLKIRKLDKATIDARLRAILSTARLEALAERYPGELSGGQQQRVSLARALVVEPETLLLDEPLSNLDANLREEMRFEIRRLHNQYRYTTVYVTHDQAEAMTTADLIAVMNHGRVEQLGPPEEIYSQPRSEFVARFIGGSNILRGTALDAARASVAGAALRTTGRTLRAGAAVALSVRQHEIDIAADPPPSGTDNHLPAEVTRQVFLGSARDYTVALGDGTELRVTAPPGCNIAPGEKVWLHLPAEQCRALAEE
jgi:iron(III) transport system ATP-binding protein